MQPEEIDINNVSYPQASKYFNPATFSIDPFIHTAKTDWGEIAIFTPEGLPYMGAELRMSEKCAIEEHVSNRFHIFVFRDGQATIYIEDRNGEMIAISMEQGVGYRIQKGQKYSIQAQINSRIMEAAITSPDLPEGERGEFSIDGYMKRIEKPWGYESHFAKEDDPLMSKILHINAGDRLSEKAHRIKLESYWMLQGDCNITMENSSRVLTSFQLQHNQGYTTYVGQRHRQQGISESEVFEVSMPEGGKTWRIQDDYERPDETDDQRRLERGEM